jgi:glyoxylase-like metal-dependent hydrolase (beta-lactamase superfamily II)
MLCALCSAALMAGCSSSSSTTTPSPSPTASAPPSIGRFASDNPGSVNTFWLTTPQGVVVIDTGRNVSGGRRAAAQIGRSGKPVVAILITHPHPHPDHVVGPNAGLDVGGTQLQTAQFGEGESVTTTAYYDPSTRILFDGDLTDNRATPALLEGHTCGWLTNLDQLQARFPNATTIYPGHGRAGPGR